LKEFKSGTVKAELTLIQRVSKTAIKEWGYRILINPFTNIKLPKSAKPRNCITFYIYYLTSWKR